MRVWVSRMLDDSTVVLKTDERTRPSLFLTETKEQQEDVFGLRMRRYISLLRVIQSGRMTH